MDKFIENIGKPPALWFTLFPDEKYPELRRDKEGKVYGLGIDKEFEYYPTYIDSWGDKVSATQREIGDFQEEEWRYTVYLTCTPEEREKNIKELLKKHNTNSLFEAEISETLENLK